MVCATAVHEIVDLRDASAAHGGKAAGLAKLIAAGLPVPDGIAIAASMFQRFATGEPIDSVLDVPWPIVAVRSSAAVEDGAAGSAAGIFLSQVAVPIADVWSAIRAVWSSALTPHAVAYASERTHEVSLGVIVQRFIEGERITVYTRALDSDDEMMIQRGDRVTRLPRTSTDPIVLLALRAEQAIGAPADVELVQGEALWIVQARPIIRRTRHALLAPPPIILAALRDGRVWTWDVTHNPDPLSPAQAGLVERVAGLGTYDLRVVAGYLYSSPREARTFTGDLEAQCLELERECEAVLSRSGDAIETYIAFYKLWAEELSPRISALKKRHPTSGNRPSSIEATLAACAAGAIDFAELVRRIGPMSPTWDVATPTFGEQPHLLQRALDLTKPIRPAVPSEIADLAERDDFLFARAQLLVRNQLLANADRLGIVAEDIFWLPLGDYAREPETLRRNASAARAAHDRASKWQMPIVVGAEGAELPAPTADLHGVGHGPRVVGRVRRFASLAAAMFAAPGDVIVVRAVTPALAVFVGNCAALVSETGGLLDHGAALARELGITCVVGCANALTLLEDEEVIAVDGDAGSITKL